MEKNYESNHTKKDIIFVWLDFGPYAYINFSIIYELSKMRQFDIIGIVNTKQDLSFFEKQDYIKFKKIIYYPECYIGKSNVSMSQLKEIEKKYDLNLWLDAFTERSFYKFWTDFHIFSINEILTIIQNTLEFFLNLIEEYKPKLILMQQAGENVSNLLLYRLAKKMNVKILMPNNLHLKDHICISDNLTSNEILDKFQTMDNNSINSKEKYDEEFLKKRDYAVTLKTVSDFDSSIPTFSKKISHYFKRMSNDLEPTYINIGKTKSRMIDNRLKSFFEFRKRQKFLEKFAKKEITNEKFLYFPLQSEPLPR